MFAFAADLTILVPIAVFVGVSVIIWLVVEQLSKKNDHMEERLNRWQKGSTGAASSGRQGLNQVSSAVSTWLAKASPQLAKPLQPKDHKQASQLRERLSRAAFRSEEAVSIFLALKASATAAALFFLGGTMVFTMGWCSTALIRTGVVMGIAFFLPDLVLYFLGSRRKMAIFLGLPDAIDLMVVCVEAGLGLDQAMRKIAEEMRSSYPVISSEFAISNLQLQMGTPRTQVLRDLGQRNGEEDLRGLVAVLIQSSKFGSGIGQSLRVHSDSMRTRRRQIAEEKATKTAVKLIVPLVLFIFPAIFVVLVGPAAINISRNLMPMMGQ
jgi:tight adherence protein C